MSFENNYIFHNKLSFKNQTIMFVESKDFFIKNKKFNLKIPKFQRYKDENKVDKIYEKYSKYGDNYFQFSPPLLIVNYMNEFMLYDGQHRFECLSRIFYNDKKSINIPINIFKCDNEIQIQNIITSYNKSLNVPEFLLDMKKNTNLIYVSLRNWLCENHNDTITKSKKNTGSLINPDLFVDNLKKINFIEQYMSIYKLKNIDSDMLIKLIDKTNQKYIVYFYENEDYLKKEYGYLYRKIKNHFNKNRDFILGIKEINWIDHILNNYPIFIKENKYIKKNISKNQKNKIWLHTIGVGDYGKCRLCNLELYKNDYSSWHASHIIAEVNGGKNTIDNMTVLCKKCNLQTGSKNLII